MKKIKDFIYRGKLIWLHEYDLELYLLSLYSFSPQIGIENGKVFIDLWFFALIYTYGDRDNINRYFKFGIRKHKNLYVFYFGFFSISVKNCKYNSFIQIDLMKKY